MASPDAAVIDDGELPATSTYLELSTADRIARRAVYGYAADVIRAALYSFVILPNRWRRLIVDARRQRQVERDAWTALACARLHLARGRTARALQRLYRSRKRKREQECVVRQFLWSCVIRRRRDQATQACVTAAWAKTWVERNVLTVSLYRVCAARAILQWWQTAQRDHEDRLRAKLSAHTQAAAARVQIAWRAYTARCVASPAMRGLQQQLQLREATEFRARQVIRSFLGNRYGRHRAREFCGKLRRIRVTAQARRTDAGLRRLQAIWRADRAQRHCQMLSVRLHALQLEHNRTADKLLCARDRRARRLVSRFLQGSVLRWRRRRTDRLRESAQQCQRQALQKQADATVVLARTLLLCWSMHKRTRTKDTPETETEEPEGDDAGFDQVVVAGNAGLIDVPKRMSRPGPGQLAVGCSGLVPMRPPKVRDRDVVAASVGISSTWKPRANSDNQGSNGIEVTETLATRARGESRPTLPPLGQPSGRNVSARPLQHKPTRHRSVRSTTMKEIGYANTMSPSRVPEGSDWSRDIDSRDSSTPSKGNQRAEAVALPPISTSNQPVPPIQHREQRMLRPRKHSVTSSSLAAVAVSATIASPLRRNAGEQFPLLPAVKSNQRERTPGGPSDRGRVTR